MGRLPRDQEAHFLSIFGAHNAANAKGVAGLQRIRDSIRKWRIVQLRVAWSCGFIGYRSRSQRNENESCEKPFHLQNMAILSSARNRIYM